MHVIAKPQLEDFWIFHPDSKDYLENWYHKTCKENWNFPADIKRNYKTASFLPNDRVVFNVCGNKYRLITKIKYSYRLVYIRFIGTHSEYNKINAEVI